MDTVNLRNARVLVTGGAGLIGSHIVDRLLLEPVGEVIVLDNFTRGRRENLSTALESHRVTVVEGDIRNRSFVAEWMKGAVEHKGSWWPDWRQWLESIHAEKVTARPVGTKAMPPIEDAPGSYVRVRA